MGASPAQSHHNFLQACQRRAGPIPERASTIPLSRWGFVSFGTFYPFPLDSVVWYRVYSSSEGATKMDTLSIGQVARKAGVGVETVRFYEREGLLEEPPRRASGYRQYSDQVEQKLVELQRMRQALLQVASLCTGRGPTGRCPMLDALDRQEPLEQAEQT